MNFHTATSSIDEKEVNKFSILARTNEWWNPNGALKTLHHINPTRMEYITEQVINHFGNKNDASLSKYQPFKGLKILDVGCGGGLVSECLARLGADSVLGLDASSDNIMIARTHNTGLENLSYIHSTVEKLEREQQELFDCIVSLEVVEHVANAETFIQSLSKLLKPNGLLIMSTMNRTPKSYLYTIAMAEYVLGLVPRGTHEWRKYVTPQEMTIFFNRAGLKLSDIEGMQYDPLSNKATMGGDVDVNYIVSAIKQ